MAAFAKGKKESPSERLNRRVNQHPSESRLLLARNLSYGSAAACLVVIAEVIQVGAKDRALEIAVVAGCISMPLWIAIGSIYECFVYLGKRSYPFFRRKLFRIAVGVTIAVAGLGLLTEVGAVAAYLSEIALWSYITSVTASAVLGAALWEVLARWWYESDGPGAKEDEDDA